MTRLLAALVLALALMPTGALAAPDVSRRVANVEPAAASPAPTSKSIGVIVRFKQPSTAPLAAQLLSAISSATATAADQERGIYAFRTPDTDTDRLYAVKLMMTASGIAYAEPNYVRKLTAYTAPTDPDFTDTATWRYEYDDGSKDYYVGAKNWWQRSIKAPGAWSIGQGDVYPTHGSAGDIKVAVLDTGFYLSHPELAGTVSVGKDECASYNPITEGLTTDYGIEPDETGDVPPHGTAVAAAVGAEVNGVGTVGSGWNPSIVGYKVAGPLTAPWDGYPAGTVVIVDLAVINGIKDAVAAGCKVITMSLSGPEPSEAFDVAIAEAHAAGVVVLASSGNDGNAAVNYPAACTYATGVGSIGLSGGDPSTSGTPTRSSFSAYGAGVVDLTAPGEMFWTATRPGYDSGYGPPGYDFWDGTSFSTPAVAGAIAYLWRAMPSLTNDEIVGRFQSSAVDMGPLGRDNYYGHGLVDMQATYNQLVADYSLAKPVVTAAPYMRSGQSVTWTASSGHEVSYQVSIDGTLRSTQSGTTYTLPSLSDGQHVISILPTSTRNWNASSLATKALTLDSTAPSVGSFSLVGEVVSWSVTEANPYTVQAYLDSAAPVTVSDNTLSTAGLSAGSHTLHVNATDSAGNPSGWITWDFVCGAMSPLVPSIVVTDAVSATVSWTAVGGADSYDYIIGAGGMLSTASTAVEVSDLATGVTEVQVRSVISSGGGEWSEWATATITNNEVVPAVPRISSASAAGTSSIAASWAPAQDARYYEYRFEGTLATTTATSVELPVAGIGTYTFEVRSVNNYRQSAWATATVTYDPRPLPALTLRASASKIAYPASGVTLSGSVTAPGAAVRVESSFNGGPWTAVRTVSASGASPGAVAVWIGHTRSLRYRFVFDGNAEWKPATSAAVSVAYAPRLTKPSTPSRVKRRARFTTTSLASAAVRNSSSTVTFRFQRYQKVSGRYKWVTRKTLRVKGSVYSSTTLRFRTKTSLPYSGKWRVYASYSGAPTHAAVASGYRYFTVR
jgi:hypothetical protein